MPDYDPDFTRIRPLHGDRRHGFEEFCTQLARRDDAPAGSRFTRIEGAGGDGGVECYWELIDGTKWGYQSKLLDRLDKKQITNSVETALRIHPTLTRYVICLPFDLSGPTGRRGSSQKAKWESYVAEWQQLASDCGLTVSFELWAESELIDRLVKIDPTGGRRRFWFDQEILSTEWFQNHIADAASDAEPRYHPQLNVKVPISTQLGAFGETPSWKRDYSRRLRRLEKEISLWRQAADRRATGLGKSRMVAAAPLLEVAHSQLSELVTGQGPDRVALRDTVHAALEIVRQAQAVLHEELEAQHGEGVASSASFRQFHAEYQGDFPAGDLDRARDLSKWLSDELRFVASAALAAIGQRTLLITGTAGAGKTHLICDAAEQRLADGLLSVVVLGEKLQAGDVSDQIRRILGLPGDLSRDQMLAALDTAAESSGSPLILFLDALNERTPRDDWRKDLSSFVKQVLRFPNLRLCLSCRSTYLDAVLPSGLELPQVEHHGFAGVELKAILRFFAWWKLDPPTVPLLQPEFFNPLFLRMLCTGLSRRGSAGLTEQPPSLREVVGLLLESSEEEAGDRLDIDPRNRLVHRAVDAVIAEMRRRQSLRLPWVAAAEIVNGLLPGRSRSESLLDFLLREGILREIQVSSTGSADEVMFGFERLGEFLLGEALVTEVTSGGDLENVFTTRDEIAATSGSAAGLNEALAILLPEAIGRELFDVDPAGESEELLRLTVRSLPWRSPGSMSKRTDSLLRGAIGQVSDPTAALDEAFALAARANHPLGSAFLEDLFSPLDLAHRDQLLCPFLHRSWTDMGAVYRLSTWAVEPGLGKPTAETTLAWASALAWCCAAADRRPRDHATMGMVALLERRSEVIAPLLERFLPVNDDYIVERVLLAAYGALIRANNAESSRAAAAVVYESLFAKAPPLNALIRDHGRSIIELAEHQDALPDIDFARCRPPYGSRLPTDLLRSEEAEASLENVGTPGNSQLSQPPDDGPAWRRVWHSVTDDDFGKKTMSAALDIDRRRRLSLLACKHWLLAEVNRTGFDSPFDNYDGYMLHQFGGGRARPAWAERVGKKYQWIALYRLIGLVADNVPLDLDPWEPEPPPELPPPLQASGERNLDPTFVARSVATDHLAAAWWHPVAIDFHPELAPVDWLDLKEFPENVDQIALTDAGGTQWLTLQAYVELDDRVDRADSESERRLYRAQLRSYLVARKRSERLWRWLRKQDLTEQRLPEGLSGIPYVFAGEYPWSTQALHNVASEGAYLDIPLPMLPTVHEQLFEFEFDCYHDETIQLLVPAPQILAGRELRWDGLDGYRDPSGQRRLFAPSLTEPGPMALLAERESFTQWLEENDLDIVWTTIAEINWIPQGFGTIHDLGYAVCSRAHRLRSSATNPQESKGITRRIRPSAT